MLELLTAMHYVSQGAAVVALSLLAWHYVKPEQDKSAQEHTTPQQRDHG